MTTDLQQRNAAFLAFLDTLNPAQREAVELVEGPVLVLAGPGTGKTQLLSARIGNILLRTDARPQNILCLTFTDAGASAMRQRLQQRIGAEAQRVPIFTFHAFCNRVISENAEYFAKGNPEPVTDLERIEIVRNILARLSPEHPLRVGKKDVFLFEEHLRELFSTMKKEGWTPGHILKQANDFLNALPENPDFIYQRNSKNYKKGDPKTAQIKEVSEKIGRLCAAADEFPNYQRAMERAARYEYEDMLLWVTRAFEKNEALLRTYQERYQYILVDEFQDTNGAQFHLLNLLLDFWEVPNIFIVGDDDQSIYEFQGARLQNLRAFQLRYQQGLKTIVLEENYRSTQAILDTASRVISNNLLRVVNLFDQGMTKQLRSNMDTAKQAALPLPGICAFPNRLQESAFIVQQIEELLSVGVPATEIAVLYARHRQAERLMTLLEKKGIPYQTKRPLNVLDLPGIRQLREILSYLREESTRPFSGEYRLFKLLHAAFWGLSELDLAKIALVCQLDSEDKGNNAEERYLQVGKRSGSKRHWRELLNNPEEVGTLAIEAEPFLKVGQLLNTWVAALSNAPLPQLLEQILQQSGLLEWALRQPDKAWHLQVLHTFMEFVRNETLRNPRLSLERLLTLLDSMDDNRLPLPLSQAAQQANGVQLLTAHAAKGLEFEHVFLLDCSEEAWDKNSGGNRGRFYLPDTLTRSGEEDALEARRRLFYVAMTRAKHALQLSFPRFDDAGKAVSESLFLLETGLPVTEIELPAPTLLKAQALLLMEASAPVIQLPDPVLLESRLAHFSLSITAFNRYLRCPLAFYYEDVLKVPGTTSEAAAFGLAIHGALQQFVLKMKGHKKLEWPGAEALSKMFGQEMQRQRGFFSENGFVQRLALGTDLLRRLHAEQLPFWRKRTIVERRIDRVELDGVPLTGILDKIEWLENGQMRIVDYKTGAPDTKKIAPPTEAQPLGGDYWRQLAFYQILLEKAGIYPEKVGKTAIAWLEPDKRGVVPIHEVVFSPDELRRVEGWIKEVYANIQLRKFDRGCGEKDCPWCQMQRERRISGTLHRDNEVGLDDE